MTGDHENSVAIGQKVGKNIYTSVTARHQTKENGLNPSTRKQKGITLVELLVVVAILSILGAVTGLFLLKYLPEYHLRSAANSLSQDLKFTQVNALRRLQTWSTKFTAGTAQTYTINNASGSAVKTVNLKNYGGEIRFKTIPSNTDNDIKFNAEGFRSSTGNAVVEMRNSRGTVIKIEVLRTGVIRVTK